MQRKDYGRVKITPRKSGFLRQDTPVPFFESELEVGPDYRRLPQGLRPRAVYCFRKRQTKSRIENGHLRTARQALFRTRQQGSRRFGTGEPQ